jgi:hypothetical protein
VASAVHLGAVRVRVPVSPASERTVAISHSASTGIDQSVLVAGTGAVTGGGFRVKDSEDHS